MPKNQAPALSATPDDDLPQTGVRPRTKDLLIQQMQSKLAEYEDTPQIPDNSSSGDDETFKKRYSDLRRFQQQKEKQFSAEINELKSQIQQLNAAQNQPLPKTREEFESWKSQYPDIVQFIEIIAEERASIAKNALSEELSTVKTKLSETEREKSYATLNVLVPELEKLCASAEYKRWFSLQPHFIQEILNNSDDPHQIAYYLNVFKSTQKKPEKTNALDALATSVKNTGTTPNANSGKWKFTQSQIMKMSSEQYEANEAEIISARNSGQILDDLSKRNSVFDV